MGIIRNMFRALISINAIIVQLSTDVGVNGDVYILDAIREIIFLSENTKRS